MVPASTGGEMLPVRVSASSFRGPRGVEEHHFMLCPTAAADASVQLEWLRRALDHACATRELTADSALFQRYFVARESDAVTLRARAGATAAVSWIRQPPVPPATIALWSYHVRLPEGPLDKEARGGWLAWRRGALTHYWTAGMASPAGPGTGAQTTAILSDYLEGLRARGMTLADNVVRTWFFVRDVDAAYGDFVAARREVFGAHGLTPATHFIASTGIEGAPPQTGAAVALDAYAIAGVLPRQIRFLAAPEHLCPTHQYGVTFERGVAVDYADRRHVLISGTASIDRHGTILHPGDLPRQLDRTFENVGALLAQAGATLADAGVLIAYVREAHEVERAVRMVAERAGGIPVQAVVAPVCRPGWLVEIECQAVVAANNPDLPAF